MENGSPKTTFFYKFLVLLLLVGLALVVTSGFSVLVLKWAGLPTENSADLLTFIQKKPGLAKYILFFQHLILFIITPLIFIRIFYKNKIFSFLDIRTPKIFEILLFASLLISVYPVMSVLTIWISQINFPVWMNQLDDDHFKTMYSLLKMENVYDLIINLTIMAIVPGIGEELMFRGIIQKEISKKWQNPQIAVWITAFLFAAVHFQIVGFVAKLCIGLVLGYAYYFTKSIFVPMFLHIINNGSATLALYFSEGKEWERPQPDPANWTQLMVFVMFVGMTSLIYFYIHQYYKRNEFG